MHLCSSCRTLEQQTQDLQGCTNWLIMTIRRLAFSTVEVVACCTVQQLHENQAARL